MKNQKRYVYFKTKNDYDEGAFIAFDNDETNYEITEYLTQRLDEDGEQLDFWHFVTKKKYDELIL